MEPQDTQNHPFLHGNQIDNDDQCARNLAAGTDQQYQNAYPAGHAFHSNVDMDDNFR